MAPIKSNIQVKSRKRVLDVGEVYTNEREVNAMLDLVKQETERIESRFLEPACGNGNFLVEILKRKLDVCVKRYKKNEYEYEIWSILAISSIYGVDLLNDNIDECKERLLGIFDDYYKKVSKCYPDEDLLLSVKHVLKHNILQGDALTMLRSDGTPIIFAQWDKALGDKFQRKDYRLDELMQSGNTQSSHKEHDLFDINNSHLEADRWYYDNEVNAYLPKPIMIYPLVSYRRLKEYE